MKYYAKATKTVKTRFAYSFEQFKQSTVQHTFKEYCKIKVPWVYF